MRYFKIIKLLNTVYTGRWVWSMGFAYTMFDTKQEAEEYRKAYSEKYYNKIEGAVMRLDVFDYLKFGKRLI